MTNGTIHTGQKRAECIGHSDDYIKSHGAMFKKKKGATEQRYMGSIKMDGALPAAKA
jgi:hypothetical protein